MRLPDSFIKALQKQKIPAFSGAFDTIEDCPTEGGIYILLLQLDAAMPSAAQGQRCWNRVSTPI